jgi:hypothetical protein
MAATAENKSAPEALLLTGRKVIDGNAFRLGCWGLAVTAALPRSCMSAVRAGVALAIWGTCASTVVTAVPGAYAGEKQHHTTGLSSPSSERETLGLTDEQLDRISRHLLRFPDTPPRNYRPPGIAERLPRDEHLRDLPESVVAEIPRLQSHKFLKLADRILLVDSARLVVAMIPRYKLVQ